MSAIDTILILMGFVAFIVQLFKFQNRNYNDWLVKQKWKAAQMIASANISKYKKQYIRK